jgi:hypothetical protein
MVAKLTRLTHKIAIQLRLVAESCTIRSYRSKRPVWKLLDTPLYTSVQLQLEFTLRWGNERNSLHFRVISLVELRGYTSRMTFLISER